jgi:predicted TIM-barrel fold metal-dependent hydrolase
MAHAVSGLERYTVISADCHSGGELGGYRDYLERRYRDDFDRWVADYEVPYEDLKGPDGSRNWDHGRRLSELEGDGIVAEVIFPNTVPPFYPESSLKAQPPPAHAGDLELRWAGLRAHNRWLADFCTTNPHRRIGVAVIPVTTGIDEAIDEVHAAAASGLRGVLIPTRWFDQPAYLDPVYEPFWSACAETGLVLHTHSGAGPADYTLGPGFVPIYTAEAWWWAARPFWVLVLSGVFERHPSLRYSIAENGAWWVPDIVKRMDEKWLGGHNTRKFGDIFKQGLSLKPSDYVDRNCFFAASTPGVDEIDRRHQIGVDNLLWGSDLPHPEGTYPHTRHWVVERFRDVPEDETRKILGHNAARLYDVDVSALTDIVERIGPTTEDVHGKAAVGV